jgi:4-diphosphocytidyl-2-C-methyl-D-erythritol kinase
LAKINLGLNIVERRPDGYHNLETVFYPVPLTDSLEVTVSDSGDGCTTMLTGIAVEGDPQQNLVTRAYRLLKEEYPWLPPVEARLHKAIPTQAGMGGGSSDGAAMLVMLNRLFALELSEQQLIDRAARLGADCPFFVTARPAYAEGIGERLMPIDLDLDGWWLCVVRPPIPVSTREAFANIRPQRPLRNCRDVVMQPVETWRNTLVNDFEASVFIQYPAIGALKSRLYDMGAVYAAMSGSGSAVFGLFREPPLTEALPTGNGMFTTIVRL